MRILLVEDDRKLSSVINKFLSKQSYVCDRAYSAESALRKASIAQAYDLILMDILLPDGNGVDVLRNIRMQNIQTPVIMLSSKKDTVDKISGLDAGADDYMPKPFSPVELSARIRAILRRPTQVISEELICSNVSMNITHRLVTVDKKSIDLMPTEYSLLEQLTRKKNQVIKKEELLRSVWGIYSNTSSNRVEVYIRYLREKVDNPFDPQLIKTVRGVGYKIADK